MIFVYYKNSDIIDNIELKKLYRFKNTLKVYYINNKYLLDVNNNNKIKSKDISYKLQRVINKNEKIGLNIIGFNINDIILYYYLLSSLEIDYKVIIDSISDSTDKYLKKFDNLLINNNFIMSSPKNILVILRQSNILLKYPYNLQFNVSDQLNDSYGYHRFGWEYVKSKLYDLSTKNGIYLDLFMEKTFLWNSDIVYNKPWYGIMHNPQNIPQYLRKIYNIKDILDLDTFKKSIKYCKGIIVLSNYLKKNLQKRIDIPIYSIKHPTPHHIKNFCIDLYKKDKKVIHIGYWLRNYDSFHKLKTKDNKKILLDKISKEPWLKDNLNEQKKKQIKDEDKKIEIKQFISNEKYDEMMMSSIIFVDLIDTSANNLIVECIQYQTPILINRHPAIIEYLGEDYPFYYETIEDANKKIDNIELIKKTNEYLVNKNKDDISIGNFIKELSIIQNKNDDIRKIIKFNIGDQLTYDYGQHRSGWKYVISEISNRIKDYDITNSIYFDTFLESTFCWGKNNETNVYNKPWSCIIHNPPNIPKWFQYEQSFESICKNKNFLKSLPYLKKIITLSDYNTKYYSRHPIIKKYNIPIYTLYHPTQIPDIKFNYDKFIENNNKKIIQIGWWLRKLHSIFRLPDIEGYSKVALGIKDKLAKHMFKLENKYEFKNKISLFKGDVELLDRVSDEEYDELLSKNIVFVEMYDSSANNLVIECIARNTPILINPVGGVVDYLGKDYPFYFNSLKEAVKKLKDIILIKKTSDYLKNNTKVNRKIDIDIFYDGLEKIFN